MAKDNFRSLRPKYKSREGFDRNTNQLEDSHDFDVPSVGSRVKILHGKFKNKYGVFIGVGNNDEFIIKFREENHYIQQKFVKPVEFGRRRTKRLRFNPELEESSEDD